MGIWEVIAGAGTLASVLGVILGVFFGIYAKQNGRVTREFIAGQNKDLSEIIIEQNREMREFTAATIERITERLAQIVVDESVKTRQEIRNPRIQQSSHP